ncbi:MAG: tRNA (adenosine(37)-N6)-threonylcarbamoyltransferase complex transferase subunit TsaD, partial [Kordiimonadaceae bacterium]|nr:tRNA (adenosine(37)-N6)-threonylcarbamoyltransferase complex transferase subunit TsaD [Kordiimonadaceae bacterium]
CVAERGALYPDDRADLCAAFQATVAVCLTNRLKYAIKKFREQTGAGELPFVVAGGVAANATLRQALKSLVEENGMTFHAPPLDLCTDNGAMIAWAGLERLVEDPEIDDADMAPRARWPLDTSAAPMVGTGKKGAKV